MEFNDIFSVPDVARPIVDAMVTSFERRVVTAMERACYTRPELEALVKETLGDELSWDKAGILVDQMYHRAVINKVEDVTPCVFKVADVYTRLAYFAQYEGDVWERIPAKTREAIDKWYVDAYAQGAKPRLEEVQRGERDLIENAFFLTLEETLAVVDKVEDDIYLVPCNCKSIRLKCQKPKNVCLLFKGGMNSELDRGHGKLVSKEEAKDIIRLADKKGLMHTSETHQAICNCCGDCCYPIRAAEKIGATGLWPKRRYDISFDPDLCRGCKSCVRVCNFDAFSWGEGAIEFHSDKCLGCTLCTSHCPVGAIQAIPIKD